MPFLRPLPALALLAATLPLSALAEPAMVKSIDVQIEMTALQNETAAFRFGNFEIDLENALTARLVDRMADTGIEITVDVSELELSNSFTERRHIADTRLVAAVHITDAIDNANFKSFELAVDVNAALVHLPPGTDLAVLPADSEDFYRALIKAFADATVARLDN